MLYLQRTSEKHAHIDSNTVVSIMFKILYITTTVELATTTSMYIVDQLYWIQACTCIIQSEYVYTCKKFKIKEVGWV